MLRRTQRTSGAAYLEALIALPVFILVFSGLFLAYRSHARGLELAERVRRCTWLVASNHCDASKIAASECKATWLKVRAGYDERHRNLPGLLATAVNFIEKIPLGDLALRLFWGEPVEATAEQRRHVSGPGLSTDVHVTRRSGMLCTPKPMSFDDIVDDSISTLWKKIWK